MIAWYILLDDQRLYIWRWRETDLQYCRNVVQHTQFAHSFLFLGYVISNSNLVFSTPKYPFDTKYNDLISDSKLPCYASNVSKHFIAKSTNMSPKWSDRRQRLKIYKNSIKENKNAYQNVFLINSIKTELSFCFYHLIKPFRYRVNGVVHILLFDVILNDVRNAVT